MYYEEDDDDEEGEEEEMEEMEPSIDVSAIDIFSLARHGRSE